MDQNADAGNEQQPDTGKGVQQEAYVRLERGCALAVLEPIGQMSGVGTEPCVENLLIGAMKILRSGGPIGVLPDRTAREKKRNDDCACANRAHRRLLELPSETKHDDSAEGRQQRNQPDVV